MRIVSGSHRGKHISIPTGFKARPTTDFAKEGLFNILANNFDFEGMKILDLFGGTGSISFEFASRGAALVDLVEVESKYTRFVWKNISVLGFDMIRVHREDVFSFLNRSRTNYDLVFADPPYDLDKLSNIPEAVLSRNMISPGGWLILEHGKKNSFANHPNFLQLRKYGSVHFSIFQQ